MEKVSQLVSRKGLRTPGQAENLASRLPYNDGEPEQPLGTAAEGKLVQESGLEYLHHGVGGAPLSEDGVTSVSDFLTRHAGGKVLVHCRKGGRAAALVLLHEARARNWGVDEALVKGREMGLDLDGGLRTMVETYLRAHPPRA